jgi:8-oxo-dGTP pyrophosphatase MutT (NUDIX family)
MVYMTHSKTDPQPADSQQNMNGHWTIVSSDAMYSNPWISVREDRVTGPNGETGLFGIVTMLPGVTVLPIDTNGNVYLIKEFQYAVGRDTIEAISGGYKQGEDRLEAAKRELKEETGLTATKFTYVGHLDPFTTVVDSQNHMYIAEGLTEGEAELEETEKIETFKTTFKQAYEWAMDDTITHGASVAVILKAWQLRNN